MKSVFRHCQALGVDDSATATGGDLSPVAEGRGSEVGGEVVRGRCFT
ncbi:MAG: hypothetical protein RIG66_09280 [Coleofasciculus sp. E2-BRE-01]